MKKKFASATCPRSMDLRQKRMLQRICVIEVPGGSFQYNNDNCQTGGSNKPGYALAVIDKQLWQLEPEEEV